MQHIMHGGPHLNTVSVTTGGCEVQGSACKAVNSIHHAGATGIQDQLQSIRIAISCCRVQSASKWDRLLGMFCVDSLSVGAVLQQDADAVCVPSLCCNMQGRTLLLVHQA